MRPNSLLNPHAKADPAPDPAAKAGPPLDHSDWLLPAILALASLAMLWKVIFTPSMLFIRDIFYYTYPSTRFMQEMCRHGALPYWNPYLNYGQPLLANPNLLFFYPYTLFIILLPIDFAYPMFYVVHFALAGIGTFFLARRWGQSRQAAFFAGFIFAFSGPLLSLGNLYNHAACAAWMPWALLATDRAVQGRKVRPWIILTLVFSLQFLAAEPFTLLATFGLCLAYALYLRGTQRPLTSPANLRILAGFVLVGGLMVALCAVQFLPSAELLSQSRRGAQGLRYSQTSKWSVHPLLLMEMLVPDFYGPALISPTKWNAVVEDGDSPYFLSVFIGFVPLFFALAGWGLGRVRRRNFVAASALLILVLSFGHLTPVFSLAYLLVPLLTLVRFPVKLLVPVVMLVSILAGWGLDALRKEPDQWKARRGRALYPLTILLACALAIWAAAWMAPKLITLPTQWALIRLEHASAEAGAMAHSLAALLRIYIPGITGFILFGILLVLALEQNKGWARKAVPLFALLGLAQLVQVNYQANPTTPRSFFTYRPPVLSQFSAPPGTFRVDTQSSSATIAAETKGLQGFVSFESIPEVADMPVVAQGDFQQKLVLGGGSMLEGIEESLNPDVEVSLPSFAYDERIYMLHQAPDAVHVDRLLGRSNVKYIIRPARRHSDSARFVDEVFNGSPTPSYLFEDLYFVPRAYVASTSIFTTSPLETLRRLAAQDFDALGTVILAADPGDSPAVHGSGPAGQVEISERQPNRVTLTARLTRPGYVVLLDRYDSNWHASIDGREVPMLRANQLFRAVYAQPSQHVILFYFRQRGLLAGILISTLTLAALFWLYVRNPGLNGQVGPAETSCSGALHSLGRR